MQSVHSLARTLCLLLAVAIFLSPVATFARPMPQSQQEAQKPQPLPATRYIPSHDYDTRNYILNLRFDWDKEQVIGTETMTFAPLTFNLKEIELDAANMTINSVKLSAGGDLKFESDPKNEKLRVMLDRAYQPTDAVTIVIDYHTNGVSTETGIGGFGRGIAFIKPTPNDPTRPKQIWSQGETEYNHYWFPCFDHPNDFATSEIIATVEKPMTVISNGKLLNVKNNSNNTRTFDWKIDAPHASYLTSIVVGEYTPVEGSYAGVPVTSYVYPSEATEGKVTTARLPDMVKFFSEKTGVKYPYDKYAQTMTRDFGGGMENISATTQTDNMIHDARTELEQTSDGLQSHELAHQWFGDYVTCRSWSDIWLNESFATYFQAMWDEKSLGRDDFLYRDVKGNQDAYYQTWARGQRRPIVTKNYANPDAVFDTYAYPRGGAVLHMLRNLLGEENWWRAINHYLTKYAHQPVETDQFRIAIEEATGKSLDWFFEEWVYKMGHPVFRVTQTYDAAGKKLALTVRQEQKPDPTSLYPQVEFFRMPVEIEIGTASGARVEKVWIEPQEEQVFTFNVDSQPMLVNFDYHDTLIKELKFDKSTDDLVYQLSRDEDMMGRMWALGQLSARAKDQATAEADKQKIASAISAQLSSDKFWGMRFEAANALSGAPGQNVRTALIASTKDENANVRRRAIQSLAASKDASLASLYTSLLNDQSYGVVRAAALALGQTKDAAAYDALTKLLETPSWRENIRAAGLGGLAALGDKRALEIGVRYAASTNPVQLRSSALAILGAIGKDDPRVFPLVSEALLEAASTRNFQLGNSSAEAIVTMCDPRGTEVLEQAKKKVGDPNIQGFFQQFVERLKRCGQKPS